MTWDLIIGWAWPLYLVFVVVGVILLMAVGATWGQTDERASRGELDGNWHVYEEEDER